MRAGKRPMVMHAGSVEASTRMQGAWGPAMPGGLCKWVCSSANDLQFFGGRPRASCALEASLPCMTAGVPAQVMQGVGKLRCAVQCKFGNTLAPVFCSFMCVS